MGYDQILAQRVRDLFTGRPDFVEKKMFGGVCFFLQGNMACGVLNEKLIVRVGPDNHEKFLKMPNTRVFDITGKTIKGWIMVTAAGCKTDKHLSSWVEHGVTFAMTLPAK